MRSEEALAQRVQWTGADVAIDDANSGQREREEVAAGPHRSRHEASNPPTGLADGLEVGSPLPATHRMRPTNMGPPRRLSVLGSPDGYLNAALAL